MAISKRKLAMPQSSFRVKDLVGTVAKSRSEWWIDATAATAWLQPADVVVLPYYRIYTPVHTPIPPLSTPLPFPFQRSPHLHRHLRSSPFYVPLLYLRALRASSSFYLSLSLSPLSFFPFLTPSNPQPSHRSPVGALIRLRSATTVLMRM